MNSVNIAVGVSAVSMPVAYEQRGYAARMQPNSNIVMTPVIPKLT